MMVAGGDVVGCVTLELLYSCCCLVACNVSFLIKSHCIIMVTSSLCCCVVVLCAVVIITCITPDYREREMMFLTLEFRMICCSFCDKRLEKVRKYFHVLPGTK